MKNNIVFQYCTGKINNATPVGFLTLQTFSEKKRTPSTATWPLWLVEEPGTGQNIIYLTNSLLTEKEPF
jgi:hypothetical protein